MASIIFDALKVIDACDKAIKKRRVREEDIPDIATIDARGMREIPAIMRIKLLAEFSKKEMKWLTIDHYDFEYIGEFLTEIRND